MTKSEWTAPQLVGFLRAHADTCLDEGLPRVANAFRASANALNDLSKGKDETTYTAFGCFSANEQVEELVEREAVLIELLQRAYDVIDNETDHTTLPREIKAALDTYKVT